MAGGCEKLPGGLDRLRRVGITCKGGNEESDDLVTDELVDDRIMLDQYSRGGVVEAIELTAKFGRRDPFRQGGGSSDVREEEAGLDLRAAVVCVEDVEAESAVERVLGPAISMEQPHEGLADAAEWRGAHLASRLARDMLEPGACPGVSRVGAEEKSAPHVLVWRCFARPSCRRWCGGLVGHRLAPWLR